MSITNPTVDVCYPLIPWLKWLPLYVTRRQVKLVRIDGTKPYFFDPGGRRIKRVDSPSSTVYRAM